MTIRRWAIGRLLAGASFVGLAVGLAGEARADFYAYAVQQTSNYTVTGVSIGAFNPGTGSSAAQLGSAGQAFSGTFDVLQAYVGGGAVPGENQFTPKGQDDAPYARGDALITALTAPPPNNTAFGTNNVAEAFRTTAGNAASSGSWSVSAPITVTSGVDTGLFSMTFDFSNLLTVVNSGALPAIVQANLSYDLTIRDSAGNLVALSDGGSPAQVNRNASLLGPGILNQPLTGTAIISTLNPLAPGTYTATISGTENVFLNVIPEPSSLVLMGFGGLGLIGFARRRRRHVG